MTLASLLNPQSPKDLQETNVNTAHAREGLEKEKDRTYDPLKTQTNDLTMLPFCLSKPSLKTLCTQIWPASPKTSEKSRSYQLISILFGCQNLSEIRQTSKTFLKWRLERFLKASSLHYESFWAPFWNVFETRAEKWKLCSRAGANPPERVGGCQICALCSHAGPYLSSELLLTWLLTILAAFLEHLFESFGVTCGSQFSKPFMNLGICL